MAGDPGLESSEQLLDIFMPAPVSLGLFPHWGLTRSRQATRSRGYVSDLRRRPSTQFGTSPLEWRFLNRSKCKWCRIHVRCRNRLVAIPLADWRASVP